MSTDNAEHSSGAADDLSGLNTADRAETEAILKEIDAEAPKPEETTADRKEPDGAAVVPKPNEGTETKVGADGKPVDQANTQETRREVGLMPKWAHEAFKDKTGKEMDALKAEVARLTGTASNGTEGQTTKEPDAKSDAELQKEADAIAEKHGITPELAKDLLESAARRSSLSPEAQEKLKDIDALKAQREIEVETAKYSEDFDSKILPLVKAEYGDDVPPTVIAKIKEELKELAYDPDGTYAKVPYSMIYKGDDKFRDLIAPVKHGPEGSRGGSAAGADAAAGEKPDLLKPLPDDMVRALSREDFDTYMVNMEKVERDAKRPSST